MNLSLIIPVYNGADFVANLGANITRIAQAVEGVEFIVVNDGSTDATASRLADFAARHPDIRLHIENRENGGVSSARNLGLTLARGEYVMFMDHDDNIDAARLAALFERLRAEGADVLHFNVADKYPAGNGVYTAEEFFNRFPFVSYVWSYIYRRDIIRRSGLEFTVGMKYLEDGLFVLQYLVGCANMMASNEAVYDYVDNPASVMRVQRTEAQNRKYLDDIALAVTRYTALIGQGGGGIQKRLREIRDSFQFIYMVNMLKLGIAPQEMMRRLDEAGYDFKMADYPSRFNNRRQVRMLCRLFRSRRLTALAAASGIFRRMR